MSFKHYCTGRWCGLNSKAYNKFSADGVFTNVGGNTNSMFIHLPPPFQPTTTRALLTITSHAEAVGWDVLLEGILRR